MKRGTKILIISITAVVIITIVSVLIKEKGEGNDIIEDIINKVQDNSEDKNTDNTNTETTSSSSSSSLNSSTSSSGSSSGGGGSSSSGGSSSCQVFEQITYSIEDINKTNVCNEYSLGNCVDKTVTCSANIKNRDSSVSGVFDMEIVFVESGRLQEDAFDSKTSSFTLTPGQMIEYIDNTNIISTGESGLANQNINCFYNSITIPQKEAC